MWKKITDAQRDGNTYYVSSWNWDKPQNAFFESNYWVWVIADFGIYINPTHYWDFDLDPPLPPPPNGGEND